MSEEVLERFGKYFLLDRIGKGGMAGIFSARPASVDANGRIMVIKRMLPQVASNPEFLSMFRTETQICMAFNHPNLVQIHDFGDIGKQAYLAMEYIEGKNLKELVVAFSRENEAVPIEMAVNIVEQAARGLHYAHVFKNNATGEKLHLIHRDVSPHNILLSYDGNIKVIDFGIAKAEIDSYDVTRDGLIKGKVGYLSPEQVEGQKLDARSDVFALGIVLWELLTGRRLFAEPGKSDLAIIQSIQHCDQYVARPSSVNTRIPEELDTIVIKSLAQDPLVRYASAEEFAAALKRFQNSKYPEYGNGDMSLTLKKLFGQLIEEDHSWLRELNQKAQHALSVIPKAPNTSSDISQPSYRQMQMVTPPPLMMSPQMPPPLVVAAARRGFPKITRGRMIGAALYVLTIAAIKLDERYCFVERLMLSTDDVKVLTQAAQQAAHPVAAHAKARATASGPSEPVPNGRDARPARSTSTAGLGKPARDI